MELSIVFVNWNSSDYLRQCIQSIYAFTTGVEFEIIVVDNASPADDADSLKREFEQITLIKSSVNLGFAAANNAGFRTSAGRYLLFLNPDTQLIGPAPREMLDSLKSLSDAGVIGCKLLNSDLSIQTSCVQSFPTILNQALDTEALRNRWPNHRLWGMEPLLSGDSRPVKAGVISGACMMIRREVFEQVGLFSEDYFMYAEDLDLCHKVRRAGFTNYYVGAVAVIHYGGKSSTPLTATTTKWHSILQYFIKHRGMGYTLRFRVVMGAVAACRLALLALAGIGKRRKTDTKNQFTASKKWRAILKTLLTHSGRTRLPSPDTRAVTFSLQNKDVRSAR